MKEAELEKGENLTKLEIVRVAGLTYIPSVLLGVSTIACIFGANALNQKKQASLMSAYVMLNESISNIGSQPRQFTERMRMIKSMRKWRKMPWCLPTTGVIRFTTWTWILKVRRLLFYDLASKKYFRTTMAAVLNAQYHVNRNLSIKGDCSLNEYLSFLVSKA
ncbi:MAG: DUF6353 family protein [Clostridium fessum]